MIIERNTILYIGDHTVILKLGRAIKIRGKPADKAVVDGNVFKHKNRDNAIAPNGDIDIRPNNQFDINPMTELGSGDFFGDGQQDEFMATGVTWWARSPELTDPTTGAVTRQWRYLNTMSERLPQLLLERVDNDAVFDVALRPPHPPHPARPPKMYSRSGTGPWTPLLSIDGDAAPPIAVG